MLDSILSITCLAIVHKVSLTIYFDDIQKTRRVQWFVVHALVNGLISFLTIPSLFITLYSPFQSLLHEGIASTKFPMCLVLWLHAYHILYHNLTSQDIFHHFIFISFLTYPGYFYFWGCLGNFQLFFICGLPGCLIYALLAAQKCGVFLFFVVLCRVN